MNQSQKITEGALYTAIFIIMVALTIFVPGFLLLFPLLLPIPFIVYASKYDWQASLLMVAVVLFLSFIVIPALSVPITVLAASGGILIGSAIKRDRSPYETWITGTSGFIGGLLFVFLFTQVLLDISWAAQLEQILQESLEMSKEMMGQFGLAPQGEEGLDFIEESIALMKNLIPVGIAIMSIIMAFLAQWVGYKVVNRLNQKTYQFPPFRNLRLPVAIIWVYLVALIISLFTSDPNSVLFIFVNNIMTLIGLLLILQGFSFMFFFTHYKKWSKAIPIIVLIISLVIPFILIYVVGLLGLIDLGFNLRDRLTQKEK